MLNAVEIIKIAALSVVKKGFILHNSHANLAKFGKEALITRLKQGMNFQGKQNFSRTTGITGFESQLVLESANDCCMIVLLSQFA